MSSDLDLNVESNKYVPLPVPIAITEHKWPEGTVPLVCTRTMTYNHEDYIRDCIEGILMQKTTFPVRVCIHDDASTDKTPAIVREYQERYPNLIWVYYQEENSFRRPQKSAMRKEFMEWAEVGSYQAICEGDDYWTDPLKLEKQISILQNDVNVSISFHDCEIIDSDRRLISKSLLGQEGRRSLSSGEVIYGHLIPTLTAVFKIEDYKKVQNHFSKKVFNGDTFKFALLAQFGFAYFHNDIQPGIYRRHSGGIFTSSNEVDRLVNHNNTFFQIYRSVEKQWKKYAFKRLVISQWGIASITSNDSDINKKVLHQLRDQSLISPISFYLYFRFKIKLFFLSTNMLKPKR